MNYERIGAFLYKLRKEHKLTQKQVGNKLFLSREAISKWEHGVNLPDPTMLIKLSELYNVSVNEILYGEHINESNKKAINETTVNVMIESKKKINKTIQISISIIVILLLLFFVTYFINNYNSIKVYVIAGDGEYFDLSQGMLITSPKKTYLQLGEIIKLKDEDILSIKLYYKLNNKNYTLIENNDSMQLTPNINYELKDKINTKEIINNLYVDIESISYKETIKLNLELDFTNTNLVNEKSNEELEVRNSRMLEHPILSKFTLVNDKYIYETDNYRYELDEEAKVIVIKNDLEEVGTLNYESYKLKFLTEESINLNSDCTSKKCGKHKDKISKIKHDLLET